MSKIQLRDRYVKPIKAKVNGKKKPIVFNCPPIASVGVNPWNNTWTDAEGNLHHSLGVSGYYGN